MSLMYWIILFLSFMLQQAPNEPPNNHPSKDTTPPVTWPHHSVTWPHPIHPNVAMEIWSSLSYAKWHRCYCAPCTAALRKCPTAIQRSRWNVSEYRLKRHTVKPLNISRTLIGNKIVDHSDVVGAASSFSTKHLGLMDWTKTTARRDEKHLSFWIWCLLW